MELSGVLKDRREKIVGKWVDYALSTYKSSEFFLKENNRFANPVGGITRLSLERLFVLLVDNADAQELAVPLQQIMQLRSVQEFTASQAVAPVNAIKHIVRDILAEDKEHSLLINDLYDFEFAVDIAMLTAFDIYMQCREQLYKVRLQEIKSGSHILTEGRCPTALLKDSNKKGSGTVENG